MSIHVDHRVCQAKEVVVQLHSETASGEGGGSIASEEEEGEGDAVKEFSYASFHSRRFPRLMLLNFSSFFIRSEK